MEGEEVTQSLEFIGKFWIKPDSTCIDVSCSEHARVAKAVMLGVGSDDINREVPLNTIFKPLTNEQAEMYLDRNVNLDAVRFLCSDDEFVDPRVFAIRNYRWIRTNGCDFYAWSWTDHAREILSKCDDFWNQQKKATPRSWAKLWNVADEGYIAGSLEVLLPRFAEKNPC